MSEIRQDKTTGQWVIFATHRGERPRQFRQEVGEENKVPQYDQKCPFCAGNEGMLPHIILEMPDKAGAGWQTRVVSNKFSALMPDGDTNRVREGVYVAMPGYGRHEVIIESPYHNGQIATMQVGGVCTIIETYHRRFTELLRAHENMMINIPAAFQIVIFGSLDYGDDEGIPGYLDRYRHIYVVTEDRYCIIHDLLSYACVPPISSGLNPCEAFCGPPYRTIEIDGRKVPLVHHTESIKRGSLLNRGGGDSPSVHHQQR